MGTADREAHEIHGKVVYFGADRRGKEREPRLHPAQAEARAPRRAEEADRARRRDDVRRAARVTRRGARVQDVDPDLDRPRRAPGCGRAARAPGGGRRDRVRGRSAPGETRRHAGRGLRAAAHSRPCRGARSKTCRSCCSSTAATRSTRTRSSACTASSASRAPASRRSPSEGTGVLQTLTTLSKLVLAELRKAVDEAAAEHAREGEPAPAAAPRSATSTPAHRRATEAEGRPAAEKGFYDRERRPGRRRRLRDLHPRAPRRRGERAPRGDRGPHRDRPALGAGACASASAIVGHSDEGLALIPLLEANPDVELFAVLTDDADAARRGLRARRPQVRGALVLTRLDRRAGRAANARARRADRRGGAGEPARRARRRARARRAGHDAADRASCSTRSARSTPRASPTCCRRCGEILESYNLTVDRRGLLNRILQIAVGSTGADRGSLMLWDPAERRAARRGRARHREGADPEDPHPARRGHRRARVRGEALDPAARARRTSAATTSRASAATSSPRSRRRSIHDEPRARRAEPVAQPAPRRVLGGRPRVRDSPRGDRREDHHARRGVSPPAARLRAPARAGPRARGHGAARAAAPAALEVCRAVADDLAGGVAHVFLIDAELGSLALRGSSTRHGSARLARTASSRRTGCTAGSRSTSEPVVLSQPAGAGCACFAVLPLSRAARRWACCRSRACCRTARPSWCASASRRWRTRSRASWSTRCARCTWSAKRPRPRRSRSSRRGSARPVTRRSYTVR